MRHAPGTSRTGFAASRLLGCPVSVVVGRSAAREAAICQAVIELLGEISYESMTMDAVAARARASKATIYRRWSNKGDLLLDALNRMFGDRDDVLPDTGLLRDDLIARVNGQIQDPVRSAATTAAIKGLVYATANDRDLAAVIRSALAEVHLHGWQTLLDRAHRRGEFRVAVDAGLIWEVAQAQFCARTGVDCGTVDDAYVQHIVDDVLMPVILHAGSRSVGTPTLRNSAVSNGAVMSAAVSNS